MPSCVNNRHKFIHVATEEQVVYLDDADQPLGEGVVVRVYARLKRCRECTKPHVEIIANTREHGRSDANPVWGGIEATGDTRDELLREAALVHDRLTAARASYEAEQAAPKTRATFL